MTPRVVEGPAHQRIDAFDRWLVPPPGAGRPPLLPTVADETEYPAARAARSSPRSVLFGPYSTALSTITPIRFDLRVASARAAWLGR